MLVLITGLPGNGKTLYALNWVKAKAEKEGRPVYYSGIADLKLPWIECDFTKWDELPTGAIVVVDEAQRVLRPRMHGSVVPPYVAALETHRHKGVDIVLITQHPMLIDSNARRLVGLHFHVVRKFGTPSATVHEWASVKESCDKNRDDSTRHDFVYPKESYGWYKSAELHTHKARIPMRVWFLGLVPLLLLGSAWGVYRWMAKSWEAPAAASAPAASAPGRSIADRVNPGGAAAPSPGLTVPEFVVAHEPRVPGLQYTAPVFDDVTKPVVAPYPAACVAMGTECRCYTQQATRLDVPPSLCSDIVSKGFFVAWKQSEHSVPRSPASGAVPLVSGLAVGGMGGTPMGSSPVAVSGHISIGQPRRVVEAGSGDIQDGPPSPQRVRQ